MPSLDRKATVAPGEHVAFRPTPSGGILVDLQTSAYFRLNRVAAIVWAGLTAGHTIDQIIESIQTQYDVDRPTVDADVRRIYDDLLRSGLLRRSSEGAP